MTTSIYKGKGLGFPHPPYPKATLRVIEKAIAEAWRVLIQEQPTLVDLRKAEEDEITHWLRICLIDVVLKERRIPGFSPVLFRVSREAKFESFDGLKRDLMPDLHVDIQMNRRVCRPSIDGLFVECKPVGPKHAVGKVYCNKGLIRYVEGDYGWAMTEGLMIGYTFNGYNLPGKLKAATTRHKKLNTCGHPSACSCKISNCYEQQPHITVHRRDFSYPSTGAKAPDITVRHVWLHIP